MGTVPLAALLRALAPVREPGTYVFASLPADAAPPPAEQIVASIREPEGLSVIVAEADAARLGLPARFRCAWLRLTVASDLAAVGLTAAVARALADAGIACNVVAGAVHDHLFVPVEAADAALAALRDLQAAK